LKLLVNTASTFKGGSIQVAKSFLEECRKIQGHEYHVVLGRSLAGIIDCSSFPAHFFFYPIQYRPATRVFSLRSASSFLRDIERKVRPDVVFSTSGPAYWRPEAPHLVGYNLPHYVYPDSPYWSTLPAYSRVRWRLKGMVIRYFFRRDADVYVVQTDDINERLRRFLKTDQVYTVSNTCSGYYFQPPPVADKLPPKGDAFRFLSLSAWYPHKRLDVIPAVIAALPGEVRQRVRFVLTLPEEDFARHFSGEAKEHIINVGPVRIEEGPALYRECDALFLPTLLECFSASYAEAMAMERPIVTSDLEFARCICRDAALYFDPMNPADIAEKICLLVRSPELRHELVEKGKARLPGFGSARSRAEQYLKICEEMAGGRGTA
jgi:glycosyltransferase involved in cell wall biosynthesis